MRRRAAEKRSILPDPLFQSELISRFINVVMQSGKKSVAEKIVYDALEQVVSQAHKNKSKEDGEGDVGSSGGTDGGNSIHTSTGLRKFAIEQFEKAIQNVKPTVEVRSRRVGGSTYQVPVEVRPQRRTALAMRWLVDFSGERNEKTMQLRLANEILDAIQGRGNAVKKREDTHRMAKANQAFAHYRW